MSGGGCDAVRVRDKCLFDETALWQLGGVPPALNAVLQNAKSPAILVLDAWWWPGLNAFDKCVLTRMLLCASAMCPCQHLAQWCWLHMWTCLSTTGSGFLGPALDAANH